MDKEYVQILLLTLRVYIGIRHRLLQFLRDMHQQRLRNRKKVLLWLISRRAPPSVWMRPRSRHWWDHVVPDFSPSQFQQNFHLSRKTFEYICSRVKHAMGRRDTNFRPSIPFEKRVAIAVWKLANGGGYKTISRLFGVGLSTVYLCVRDFCVAVTKLLLPIHIRCPDADQLVELSTLFHDTWGAPQCVGVLGACHILVAIPNENPQQYRNQKGGYSVILQAVVDGKGHFWDICVDSPGSACDAAVLQRSPLRELLSDGQLLGQNKVDISGRDVGHYLIGGPSYPAQEWLMTPFRDTEDLTPEQVAYNSRLNRARSVLEAALGRLKGRWRCLTKKLDCKVELAREMAIACCVLHNICEEHGDDFQEAQRESPPGQTSPMDCTAQGPGIRTALLRYFSGDNQ
ncbi:uncharacterized protein LOC127591319 isoform X6 [Hippocampus zosterae]|uniref:uncharacterized protein LOC127591319 isoform X6 n=1 Tax=Hippocampus zosterae TaxID=109293 RepID=UPI00223E25A4|nr:uncharacterized protein LOC127591319 isoform X6 [Hippocampus zosterae]